MKYTTTGARAAFDQFCKNLMASAKTHFGDSLRGILQFGSTVEQLKPATDLDLLVVLSKLPLSRRERYTIWDPLEENLKHELKQLERSGVHLDLSPILLMPPDLDRFRSFYLDLPTTSKIWYDPDGVLASLLDRIREYIRESGAVRKQRGNLWYWDLAPHLDYRTDRKIGW
ncbi:MAG: hypothetical protein C5B49_00245 [Bdellovibrio sp.]|nr:MAG: hypothetical protein C5B49_00245 [Bdellovibrio sp.]